MKQYMAGWLGGSKIWLDGWVAARYGWVAGWQQDMAGPRETGSPSGKAPFFGWQRIIQTDCSEPSRRRGFFPISTEINGLLSEDRHVFGHLQIPDQRQRQEEHLYRPRRSCQNRPMGSNSNEEADQPQYPAHERDERSS